ncbi:hypothetical protein ACLK2H_05970 [Escherichia coli]
MGRYSRNQLDAPIGQMNDSGYGELAFIPVISTKPSPKATA